MIEWAKTIFDPINLYNAPRQDVYTMRLEVEAIAAENERSRRTIAQEQAALTMTESHERLARKALADKEFIYYTRSGHFLKQGD